MKLATLKGSICAALAAGLIATGTTVFAKERVYDCKARHQTSNGFVGPQIVFFVDETKGSVRVLDGLVQHFEGGPVEGDFNKRSDKVYVIKWVVHNVKGQTTTFDVDYSATLNISTNRYTMRAVVRGYDNNVRGEGQCTIAQ